MTFSADRGKPAVSLNAANGANVQGDTVAYVADPHGHLPWQGTYQLAITNGTVTALDVDILGSHDGTNFFVLKNTKATTGEITAIPNLPVAYLRARLNSVTGAGKITVSFAV